MFNINKPLIILLQSFALVSVVTLGLLSILASGSSGSSSGDEPAPSFADAGPDQNVLTQTPARLDGSGSETPMGANPDGDVPTYLWTVLSTPSQPDHFLFENVTAINPTFSPSYEGEYVLQLRVNFRGVSAFDTVSIFGYSDSLPPNAKAGPDQFVKHGTLVTLDASGSHSQIEYMNSSSRLPFEYSWYMNRQPAGTSSSLSATDVVNPGFIAEFDPANVQSTQGAHSSYETRLHVINSDGLVSRPVHTKTFVYPAEGYAYPTPVAGPRQKVVSGSTVLLDGSASFDVDDRPLSYDWEFYARPPGSNATLASADTASPSFVADQDGVYVVQLQVDNGERSSIRLNPFDLTDYWGLFDYAGNDRVVISATGGSLLVTDAGADRILSFTGPVTIPLDGSGSNTAGGGGYTYRWYLISAPVGSGAGIDIPEDTMPDSASLLADVAGSYVVGLSLSGLIDHVVITLTENNAPTAVAGDDQAVSVGDAVMLNGSSSNDLDGNPLGYSWSLVSAPGPWGRGSNGVWMDDWPFLSDGMAVAPTFTPDLNGEYRLLLTVNDGEQSSVADGVIITASGGAVNTAPTADAGPDQPNAVTGVQVALDGSGSSDPDTNPITFLWHVESVPPNSMMTDGSLATTTSEQPVFTPDLEGVYQFSLVVNDGQLDSTADTVNITATDSAGVCSNPLTLQTGLPYLPGMGEAPTIIQIDASGINTIRLVTFNEPSAFSDVTALQASIPDLNQITEANFITTNANWTVFSRTHGNPVSDAVTSSYILERQSDNIFFKIDLEFTGSDAFAEVQIDSLTACRCGEDAGDCP